MSNDALIMELSANLGPVRRRSVLRDAALLLALGSVELALLLGLNLMRPDMGEVIGSTYMLWKLGGLASLAVISGVTAISSFSPPKSPRQGLTITFGLAVLAMIAGAILGSDAEGTLLERLSPIHGIICSLCIIILSLPMMAMMAVLMRRAAPSHPERSAMVAGLAASTWAALVFAVCCPVNDPLYVIVWYSAACAIVTAASRWLLPRGFRL